MVNGPVKKKGRPYGKWVLYFIKWEGGGTNKEQMGGGVLFRINIFLLKESRLFKYMFSLYSKYSLGPLQISRNCATSCDHLNKETIYGIEISEQFRPEILVTLIS